jgi:hypothetical protein
MRWLAPGADAARILTTRPNECLRTSSDPDLAYSIALGRTAFRTPLLLGGVAARAGVSCETCHANGRRNADFDFPGVSGPPGTADVTSSLFSSHRGDGIDNPRPIPDLGGPKAALKVSQDPGSPALERFIHGLVTEEFDGAEPPPAVLKGLADYVRALQPVCALTDRTPWGVADALGETRLAARAALSALGRHDAASAVVMIQSVRSQLGAIYERYAGPDLAAARSALAVADLDLRGAEDAARAGRADDAVTRLTAWLAALPRTERLLKAGQSRSLYAPSVLAAAAR